MGGGASRELELKFLGQLDGPTTVKATVLEERVARRELTVLRARQWAGARRLFPAAH